MRLKLYRGWWYAVWRENGATKRAALRTQDRAVAAQLLADHASLPAKNAETVAEIYAAYLVDKGTERARYSWKQLTGTFGHLRPDQIGRPLCRTYVAARRKSPVGDGTIHTELTYLRAALLWHNKATPAVVELPSKPAPRSAYLTREQYQTLLATAETPHVKLFIVLALATAGRMTAILELTWSRVDFERGQIQLGDGRTRRKGRATVPMNDTVRAALLEAAEARTSDYVIEFAGKPILRIIKAFRAVAAKAELPWCSPHVLRHTAAVWMAEADIPITLIAQYLGHSDSRITERVYSRYSTSYMKKAADALEM
jgi:integrase